MLVATLFFDSSPVVFIQEIQRKERWEPRKGALHAYMKTTGDESAIRASQATFAISIF